MGFGYEKLRCIHLGLLGGQGVEKQRQMLLEGKKLYYSWRNGLERTGSLKHGIAFREQLERSLDWL